MEKHLEHELKLPVIVASEEGIKQPCAHCGREVVTLNPVEEGLCETCFVLVHDLHKAQAESGFRFGF